MESPSNSTNDKNQVKWYVMSAYKQEKNAEEVLSGENGLDFYIAKHYVVRTYHGHKTKRLVPCIPNIIFVHASHSQIIRFKERYNYIRFVTWIKSDGREYLIVPEKQMESFIKVSSSHNESVRYYLPEDINIAKGTHVKVIGGPFDGVEGEFLRIKGKRSKQIVIRIPNIMAISVEVEPDLVEVIS